MKIRTTRFGTLDVDDDSLITFSRGLFGFEEVDRYVLLDHREGSPFKWLQAAGRPELAFVLIEPSVFSPDYAFELPREDLDVLGCFGEMSPTVFVIVGIPEDPAEMTANLKGPVLIHFETGRGRQILLEDERYPARFRIVGAITDQRAESPR